MVENKAKIVCRFFLTSIPRCVTMRHMIKSVSEQMGVRFTPEDRKLITALRKKLGVSSISEVLRLGLRALAAKEGVAA